MAPFCKAWSCDPPSSPPSPRSPRLRRALTARSTWSCLRYFFYKPQHRERRRRKERRGRENRTPKDGSQKPRRLRGSRAEVSAALGASLPLRRGRGAGRGRRHGGDDAAAAGRRHLRARGRAWEAGIPGPRRGGSAQSGPAAPPSPSHPRSPPHRTPSAAPRLTKAIRGEAHLHLAPRPLRGGCTGAGAAPPCCAPRPPPKVGALFRFVPLYGDELGAPRTARTI